MIRNMIMAHNQKQKSLSYGQCLTSIFKHFEILLTGMDRTLYSQLMEIDNITLSKMKYMLNEDGVWVSKDQTGAHDKEENDKEEEQCVGSDVEFETMFKIPPPASSPEEATTSTQSTKI